MYDYLYQSAPSPSPEKIEKEQKNRQTLLRLKEVMKFKAVDTVLEGRIKFNIKELNSKLMTVAGNSDLEEVKRLLCLGTDINTCNE